MYENQLIMAFINIHSSEHQNIKRAPVGAIKRTPRYFENHGINVVVLRVSASYEGSQWVYRVVTGATGC